MKAMQNSTFIETLRNKPYGWTFEDPSKFPHYKFEEFDYDHWNHVFATTRHIPFIAAAAYIVLIFGLEKFMKNRPAYRLEYQLFLWNAVISLYSATVFVNGYPALWRVLQKPAGLYTSVCIREGMNASAVFWGLTFVFSKYVEMGDLVFSVLRKRPVDMVQLYHHVLSLILCWLCGIFLEPIMRWAIIANSAVHSVMYGYLALKALGLNMPRIVAKTVLFLEVAHLAFVFVLNAVTLGLRYYGHECDRHPYSVQAFGWAFGSFFVIFAKLYYDKLMSSRQSRKQD